MWISDDFGDSTHELLSLAHFRKYILPYLNDLVEYIDSLHVPVLLHSCGHITGYLDDLRADKDRFDSSAPADRGNGSARP